MLAPDVLAGTRWVAVFLEKPPHLTNEETSILLDALSETDRKHRQRLVTPRARETFLASRALLRMMLAALTGLSATAIDLEEGPHGKPQLDEALASEYPIRFNVSHSPTHILIGLSAHGEIGVDIETIKPFDDRLPGRFFNADEVRALDALPSSERAAAFFHLWVVKEACIKALGLPLGPTIASVAASLGATGRHLNLEWEALESPLGTKAAIALEAGDVSRNLPAGEVRYATLTDVLDHGDP